MRILYHQPLSPACRKIRLLLTEKKLPFQLKLENPWERRAAFLALNPAAELPVLKEENDLTLCGSYAITEYLQEEYQEASLALSGQTSQERAEVRRLTDWFEQKFNREVTQNLLYEKLFKRYEPAGGPDTHALRAGRRNLPLHLDYIAHLLRDSPWLAAERLTLADLTAGAHLSALDYLGDIPWDTAPQEVKQWYAVLKSRPSFHALLTERVKEYSPPPYYENPDF